VRRLLPCGVDAVLVECGDGVDALQLWHRLTSEPPDGVREAVAGARTVLVLGNLDHGARQALLTLPGVPVNDSSAVTTVIPVRYDGVDLDAVAELTGLRKGEVIERHCEATYTAAFAGFVPGFAYLTGLDRALRLPRRDSPRTRVPAGSVAIADIYSAVYPADSPGGWHVIGTTELILFDPARVPAATLQPGARVRFEAIA
jgi:KipI family sensor histidine kinase inhibitor